MSISKVPAREGGAETRRRPHAVFISDFLHLPVPFADAALLLVDKGGGWLLRLEASSSSPSGGGKRADAAGVATVTMRIGFDGGNRQKVVVTAFSARIHHEAVIVPITWEPTGLKRLLPLLDADLELSALDGSTSRLAINGRYLVPLGQFGLGLDNVGMHRVAEASLRSFLHEVRDVIINAR
jgi:hypothetical protein